MRIKFTETQKFGIDQYEVAEILQLGFKSLHILTLALRKQGVITDYIAKYDDNEKTLNIRQNIWD